MTKPKAKQNRLVFSDAEIQTEIWQGIRMHPELGLFDLDSLSVLVKDGVVLFTGHVSNEHHRELIKNIAYALPAINAVRCDLIVDPDLSIEVDRTFSTDERSRPFIFPVGCSQAGVRVGGTEYLWQEGRSIVEANQKWLDITQTSGLQPRKTLIFVRSYSPVISFSWQWSR